jgi:glycosyltransferase involved in cell wall biosynthesis
MGGHVGLNLVYLVPRQQGGMETYARELITAMVAASPETRFTAFVNREAAEAGSAPWNELMPAVTVPVRATRRTEWVRGEQLLLPRLARRAGIDVLHSLGGTAPALGAPRRAVTVHDLHYRTRPEAHLGVAGWGMRALVPLAVKQSHLVISPSEASRREIVELLDKDPGATEAIPHGGGAAAPAVGLNEGEARERFGLGDRKVALSLSAKRPHKNLARLLDALASLPAPERPVLVLGGYSTPHEDELRAQVARLDLESDVRFAGWIDPSELEGLYAAAAFTVFPSLAEGFGLPVLEAMNRGVPVVCSDIPTLREVAGDAALLVDPMSVESIAGALRGVHGEARRLRAAGPKRAAEFSWQRSAQRHLAAYDRLLSGMPGHRVQQVAASAGS